MINLVVQKCAFAAFALFWLPSSVQAEDISGTECAKISAGFKELADTNSAYAEVLLEISSLNFDLVASAVPDDGLHEKISAALGNAPELDGKVVLEGLMAFQRVCSKD